METKKPFDPPPSFKPKKAGVTTIDKSIAHRSEQISSGLTERIHLLDPNKIEPNPYQPRKHFNKETIKELARDIERDGQLQPIIVIDTGARYVLVVGERRVRACRLANKEVKAIIERGTEDSLQNDSTRLQRVALMENIRRDDLSVIDKAEALLSLSKSPEYANLPKTDFASKIDIPYATLNRLFRILDLPESVKERVRTGDAVSIRALDMLSRLSESEAIVLYDKILADNLNNEESLDLISKSKEEQKPTSENTKPTPKRDTVKHGWGVYRYTDKKITIEITKDKADKAMLAEINAVIDKYSKEQ